MKKFFYCLLILAIFSSFVFWIGWSQFKVKPNCIGIVVSKTTGILEEPVVPGKFTWNWQFLLPTNASIISFGIQPVNLTKLVENQLPGASFYTTQAYKNPFQYNFDFSISLTVTPENVVKLYSQNKISNDNDLKEYLSNAASALAVLAANYYIKKYEDNPSYHPESVRRDDLMRSIKSYEEYPEIEILTFALNKWQFPDFVLYKQLQNQQINQNTNVSSILENELTETGDGNE